MELKAAACEWKFAGDEATRTFEGYGAFFGNIDSYGDVIEPGAFVKTLGAHKQAGTRPPMLLDHGMSAGGSVIGVWDALSEDGTGLYAKGRLIDTTAGNDAYVAMKEGALTGMSIGYRATEFELRARPDDPKRRLKSVDLVELSVVAVPANPKARVAAVKSWLAEALEAPTSIREYEEFLRDVGGFSVAQSKALASGGWKAIDSRRDAGDGLDEVAAMLRRNINLLKGTGQ